MSYNKDMEPVNADPNFPVQAASAPIENTSLPPRPFEWKRAAIIVGGLLVVLIVSAYFGRRYLPGYLSTANHYAQPYTLVADSVSQSASIILNLPSGITAAEAANNVTFEPAIAGTWVSSNKADQLIFQPSQKLSLGKYYTATLAVKGASLSKDFLIADDPKITAVFPAAGSEASEYSDITIVFNRPMVPLTVLDAFSDDASKFVEIAPATPGKFKWISTRNLQFVPETSLVPSSHYTVHIKPGFVSVEGLPVSEASYNFVTRNLRYANDQQPASINLSFNQPFRILFNQAVDLQRTQGEITVTNAQGMAVPVSVKYGTRGIRDQNGKVTSEITDASVLEVYGAKDKFGRANFWDFDTSYNYLIRRAYPIGGDINLEASQGGSFRVNPIITGMTAESPRSDVVAADVFDPQGKLIVAFGEPVNKDRMDISAPHLTGVDYGDKCKVDENGYTAYGSDGNCEKETDYQTLKLSFTPDAFAIGESIPVQFKSIVGQDGIQVNSQTITETAQVYPKLQILKTSPTNGATNVSPTGITLCTNSPLAPATEDNFPSQFKTNLPTGQWDWAMAFRVAPGASSTCAVGQFQNAITIGLAPLHPIRVDLRVTDQFGQTAGTSLDFQTGSAPEDSRNFYQMQKVYNVTSPDRMTLTYAVENLSYMNMNICEVSAMQMFQYLSKMPDATTPASGLNCINSIDKRIDLPDRYWTRNYFQIKLSDYLANPIGHYVLTFSNPEYRQVSWQWNSAQQKSVRVEGAQIFEKAFVTVTNLAVQEKKVEWSGDQAQNYDPNPQITAAALQGVPQNLYWVTRFGSLDPVAGAKIAVMQVDPSGNASQIDTATTDENGIARAVVHPIVHGAIVAAGSDSAIVSENTDIFQYASPAYSPERVYLYTDRPIYRPGQDVFVKGLDRVGYDGNWQMLAGQKTDITIKNNKGEVVYKDNVTISNFGTFTTHFTLDSGAALGTYSIQARGGYGSFDVEEYVGSPFKVDVASDKSEYIAGDTANINVNANYFFGVPVQGGEVDYSITSQDYYFDKYQDEYFNFGSGWYYDPYSGYGDTFIAQGKAVLSSDGKATFAQSLDFSKLFKADAANQSKIFIVNVTVKNGNGQSVSSQQSFIVHRGEFYTGVSLDKDFFAKGDQFTAKVKTVDTQGKPISVSKVTLAINRITWTYSKRQEVDGNYYYQDQKKLDLVTQADVGTDRNGNASHSFTVNQEGEYQMNVTAQDGRGNPITTEQDFYVYGSGEVAVQELNNETLDLATDKQTLNVGDTAHVIIKSPFPQAKALITLERGKIFDYKIVNITGNLYDYSFTVDPSYVPNVYFSALLLSPRPDVKFGQINFQINTNQEALKIDVKSDKTSYLPGEKVNLSIDVHDAQGNPAKTELSLAVADLSVLALKGNPKKNPLVFFYDGLPLTIVTASNIKNVLYEAEVPAGTKGGGGGSPSDLATKKRGDFKDTAYWQGSAVTDDNGHANVSFTLPDNLTTWQVESIGITKDTKLGVAYNEFVAQKDVMTVPLAPRFVVPGDQFNIGAQVFNQTATAQKPTISFVSKTLQPTDKTSMTVTIAAHDTYTAYFSVVAPASIADGSHTFTLSAKNADYEDTVDTTIPITRDQTYETVATANYTTQSMANEYVWLPDAIVKDRGGVTIQTSATLAVFLSDALKYLFSYPYGCSEQIASKLRSIAIVKRGLQVQDLQKSFNLPEVTFDGATYSVDDVVKLGLSQIYQSQKEGGGISYYANLAPDYSLTLSVLDTLVELKKAGYAVDGQVMSDAAKYLYTQLSTNYQIYQNKDLVILSAYTLSQIPQYQNNNLLTTDISNIVGNAGFIHDQVSSESLAYLAMVVTNGYPSTVKESIFKALGNRLTIDSRGSHIEGNSDWLYYYYETPVKDTALFLKAFADDQRDSPELANVIRWITRSRDADGAWGSTNNTAAVVDAFTDYLNWKQEMKSSFALLLGLDGKQVASFDFNASTILTTFSQFMPVSDFSTNAMHTISFQKQDKNSQQNGFYYDMSLQYYLPADQIAPRDEGFSIQRAFYTLDDKDLQNPVTSAHQGDVLRGHLTIVVPETRNFVSVEDFIPAGTELVNFNLATEDQTLQSQVPSQNAPYYNYNSSNYGAAAAFLNLGSLMDRIKSFFGVGSPTKTVPPTALSQQEVAALIPNTTLYPDATESHDDRLFLFVQHLAPGVYNYDYFVRALVPGTFNHLPATVSELYTPENFGRTGGEQFTVR
jgi:uncharacterized protein YfaS (alpha-2-macroglobulin family)